MSSEPEESAENVRKAFDWIESDLHRSQQHYEADREATGSAVLLAAGYLLAGLREVAVQIARLADQAERRE